MDEPNRPTGNPVGQLPNLVLIGAYKAGTTSMYRYLSAHPDVYMCPVKEPNFFSHHWVRGVDWYRSQFPAPCRPVVGEASTSYSRWPLFPDVAQRLHSLLPDARIIYVMRHPIGRMVAQFRYDSFHFGYGREIDRALLELEDHFLANSRYATQISRYLDVFPREQILLLTSEELRRDPAAVMRTVWAFLGVCPLDPTSEFARAFNLTCDQRKERAALTRCRSLPGYGVLRDLVPAPLRRALWSKVASTKIDDGLLGMNVTEQTRAILTERLQPDLVKLRLIMGAGFDCWGLLDDGNVGAPPAAVPTRC